MKKFAIFILCLCFLAACGGTDSKDNTYHATYMVDGSCSGYDVLYQTVYGKMFESVENASWSYTFDAQKGDYLFFRVDGLNCLQDIHMFSAAILINGEKVAVGYCIDPNCKGIELDLAI